MKTRRPKQFVAHVQSLDLPFLERQRECTVEMRRNSKTNCTSHPLAALFIFLFAIGTAHATTFSFENTIDFFGSGTDNGPDQRAGSEDDISYLTIGDNSNDFDFAYTHYTEIGTPSGRLEYGTVKLAITHRGNANGIGEFWLAATQDDVPIGTLGTSNNVGSNDFVTEEFILSDELLDLIQATPSWTLSIRFNETTPGMDTLDLALSLFTGEYNDDPCMSDLTGPSCSTQTREVLAGNPIPVSGTLSLIGLGLMGLGCLRRKSHC